MKITNTNKLKSIVTNFITQENIAQGLESSESQQIVSIIAIDTLEYDDDNRNKTKNKYGTSLSQYFLPEGAIIQQDYLRKIGSGLGHISYDAGIYISYNSLDSFILFSLGAKYKINDHISLGVKPHFSISTISLISGILPYVENKKYQINYGADFIYENEGQDQLGKLNIFVIKNYHINNKWTIDGFILAKGKFDFSRTYEFTPEAQLGMGIKHKPKPYMELYLDYYLMVSQSRSTLPHNISFGINILF